MKTPKAKYLDRIMVPFHCSTLFQNHQRKGQFLASGDRQAVASIHFQRNCLSESASEAFDEFGLPKYFSYFSNLSKSKILKGLTFVHHP
jgi:hypothetical protein